MNKRMLVALVALAGVFVASYLALYKHGYIGTLACAVGSCEKVQTSRWATFIGLPVAVWGVGYYVLALALALVGLGPRYAESRRLSEILVGLTGWGVLFSCWLTYLELFSIHAKELCTEKDPLCPKCPLLPDCPTGQELTTKKPDKDKDKPDGKPKKSR